MDLDQLNLIWWFESTVYAASRTSTHFKSGLKIIITLRPNPRTNKNGSHNKKTVKVILLPGITGGL